MILELGVRTIERFEFNQKFESTCVHADSGSGVEDFTLTQTVGGNSESGLLTVA